MLENIRAHHVGRINQIGLALHGLESPGSVQQSIFEDIEECIADERLQAALDTIQMRFGRDSVTRGTAMHVKSGTKKDMEFTMVE